MNNHRSIADQSDFIWYILNFYFIKNCIDSVIKLASSMHDQDFEFTQAFENLILKLWETSDAKYIIEIAKEAVFQKLFAIEKYILTIALLVEIREINISDAALLLKFEETYDYASLNAKVKHVIDVAWLVNEDTKDGVMASMDDSVLFDALNDVRAIYLE